MRNLMSYEATAHFLGVHPTTVSDYANYGHLKRIYTRDADGRKRVFFAEDDVLAFAEAYPQDSKGRRHPPMERTVSPCITREVRSSGEVKYCLKTTINGSMYAKTFKTLQGAERHRDRKWAEARNANSPVAHANGQQVSIWERIKNRMNRTPWGDA
jgi:hypothetical protein